MDPTALGIPWKRQLWHKWKGLRNIPFRKQWFVGYDLEGNSYWELIDRNNPTRLRRKVSLDRPYFHFSDFKPHPMWMQWLQYTRRGPPELNELVDDMRRQFRMKQLAQQANEKWNSVPLKGSPTNAHDPRIDSAWTGGAGAKAIKDTVEDSAIPVPDSTEPPALNNQERLARAAMARAEDEIKKAPKVERGQVRQRPPSNGAPQSPPPNSKDEPTTASFQPKQRS